MVPVIVIVIIMVKHGRSPIDIVMMKHPRSRFPDVRSPIALNYFLNVLTKSSA